MLRFSTILLVNFLLFKTCKSSGKISVFLSEYKNPSGKLANGNDCDSVPFSACDPYFIVCVDQPTGSLTDMGQCTMGKYQTGYVADTTQIDFRQNKIHENPRELSFDIWQGGFIMKVQVKDHDAVDLDDFVELLYGHFSVDASTSSNAGAKTFELRKRTQLTFQVAVNCDTNWFGPRCDCQPSNNDASGNYSCNATTGEKLCQPNWYGSECNIFCQPSNDINGHFECAPDGRKICYSGSSCKTHNNGPEVPITRTPPVEGHVYSTGFNPEVAGIIIAVLVLIIVINISVKIWKVCRRRKQHLQQGEISQGRVYRVGGDAIEPYYISASDSASASMRDDNSYSYVDERIETQRNVYYNIRQGGRKKNNTYYNQQERKETETDAYLNPEGVRANTYLEILPA